MERRRWKSALENASVVSEQQQPPRATTNLNGLVMLICHLLSLVPPAGSARVLSLLPLNAENLSFYFIR